MKFKDHDLKIVYHSKVSGVLRKKLEPLRFRQDGYNFHIIRNPYIYSNLKAIVAYDELGKIRGWSGIFELPEDFICQHDNQECGFVFDHIKYSIISTYVQWRFRHIGIGKALSSKAKQILKRQNKKYVWQDADVRRWIYEN